MLKNAMDLMNFKEEKKMIEVTLKNKFTGYKMVMDADTVLINPVDTFTCDNDNLVMYEVKYIVISWGRGIAPDAIAFFDDSYIMTWIEKEEEV